MRWESKIHVFSFLQDARNVARILVELAKLEVRLETNTVIHPVRVIFFCIEACACFEFVRGDWG
jgi:hypothetical protein